MSKGFTDPYAMTRQACINMAVALATTGKIKPTEIVPYAKDFQKFIGGDDTLNKYDDLEHSLKTGAQR